MTAIVLLAALLLDAALGEPRWIWSRWPHPAVLMGRGVSFLERKLNRGTYRRAKGVLTLACLVISSGLLGLALSQLGALVEILLTAILLAQRSLTDHVNAVATGLRQGLPQGRAQVAWIVSRDTSHMTESNVARSAIESAAENLSDGVIAPAFWALLLGLPGLLIYKVVNTADSMIGYKTPRYHAFGWASARFDDLLNLIPARLTALMIALLYGRLRHWPAIMRDARHHKSPNAGWPEAALSRALGIALAGPRSYNGTLQRFPFVNATGRKHLTADDINASTRALWSVWAMFSALIALLFLFHLST